MNIEEYCEYCLAKPGVTESFPFDEKTLVFKVMGKMFALADVDDFDSINLKCDPEKAIRLREEYEAVNPGYHMSKVHWNTVMVNDDAPDKKIYEWIDHSYDLVVKSLTKKLQAELNALVKKSHR
jgi:predicted DNA-binding protein (MmcQ/YjbR family)